MKVIDERIEEIGENQPSSNEDKKDGDDDGNLFRKRRMAFLDLLIQLSKEANFSRNDIQEEVDTFMFEVSDSSPETPIREKPYMQHCPGG